MRKISLSVLWIGLMLEILMGCALAGASQEAEQQAQGAAQEWLELVDEGKYPESWEAAASYFKTAVAKEQWERSLAAFRKPLGEVLSRKAKSRDYKTALPGAPDGEYVVLQFETSFESKESAIETVTPMREKDGCWKVSGYFIQ